MDPLTPHMPPDLPRLHFQAPFVVNLVQPIKLPIQGEIPTLGLRRGFEFISFLQS